MYALGTIVMVYVRTWYYCNWYMYSLGTIARDICTHLVLLQWCVCTHLVLCNGYIYALDTFIIGICTDLILL